MQIHTDPDGILVFLLWKSQYSEYLKQLLKFHQWIFLTSKKDSFCSNHYYFLHRQWFHHHLKQHWTESGIWRASLFTLRSGMQPWSNNTEINIIVHVTDNPLIERVFWMTLYFPCGILPNGTGCSDIGKIRDSILSFFSLILHMSCKTSLKQRFSLYHCTLPFPYFTTPTGLWIVKRGGITGIVLLLHFFQFLHLRTNLFMAPNLCSLCFSCRLFSVDGSPQDLCCKLRCISH